MSRLPFAVIAVLSATAAADPRGQVDASTVMGRLPGMSLDDSYRPEKIAEAFQRVPRELVVSVQPFSGLALAPAKGWTACKRGEQRAIHAGWIHDGKSSRVEMFDAAGDSVVGVPLLVWQRDGKRAIVVSIDGLRYVADDLDALEPGVPPRAVWPKTPRPLCMTEADLDPAVAAKPAAARVRVAACVTRAWEAGERALEAECAAPRSAFEAAMLSVIDAQAKTRVAPLATATAALSGVR